MRFTNKDIEHGMERLGLGGADGEKQLAEILAAFDRGHGDIDDVIDEYEDAESY